MRVLRGRSRATVLLHPHGVWLAEQVVYLSQVSAPALSPQSSVLSPQSSVLGFLVMAEYQDREHFIPLRRTELVELLGADPELPAGDRDLFRQFCRLVA